MNINRGNNNSNNNNNRRRGRSNNNRPQGGGGSGGGGNGGQQLNRVDSRSRGNAPQMLEKYRKLAHDAHLNGDRVTAEYYLQFADHYFRVIADTRLRQEEQRQRRDERWQEGDAPQREEADDGSDFSVESDFPSFDQPPVYHRREREERPERTDRPERTERPERTDRPERAERPERSERPVEPRRRDEPPSRELASDASASMGESDDNVGGESPSIFEPPVNPFLREGRTTRGGLRPRRDDRRPRPETRDDSGGPAPVRGAASAEPMVAPAAGLDPSSLPPSISAGRKFTDSLPDDGESAEAAPAPKRRTRRKPSADDAGEALETVG